MAWYENMEEGVIDFVRSDFSPQVAKQVLDILYYGAYEDLYSPADATHIILVHSNSEYQFTPNDLIWLEYATSVLSYRVVEEKERIFFLNMKCSREDYYLICAAIIKVFNRAFPGVNLFFFKIKNAIAIGSARDFDNLEDNDFALSGLISEKSMEKYEEFFDMLCYSDIKDIPSIIISYSPQEKENNLNFERSRMDPDYLSFLSEYQSRYGIDTLSGLQRYLNKPEKEIMIDSHSFVYKQLLGIADSDIVSSYEVLDAAVEAEEKLKKVQFSQVNHGFQGEDVESNYSKEAFDNAEQMLKEMLGESEKRRRANEGRG